MDKLPKQSRQTASKGGRPSKFEEPSSHVTLTLPDRILERLGDIDSDRSKAVVKAVESVFGGAATPSNLVRELRIGKGEKLLIVSDNRLLRSIPWLTMIEIAPGRHLLSLKDDATIEKLELTIGDLLDTQSDAKPSERKTLEQLRECIRKPRRNRAIQTEEILVVKEG